MLKFVSHPLIKENTVELRLFQELIFKSVLEKGNSLVVLPTALGKTIIAVMVAAELLLKKPEKKVLVLAPTKPLALQHKERFARFLKLDSEKIILLTGEITAKKRVELMKKAKIICATPQTIENDVIEKRLLFDDFSLIVFDEAHRAVKDYAYVFIAKEAKKHSCLMLGLTASPGSEREKIEDICRNLSIENIEVKSLNDFDVKPYTKEITLEWQTVELPSEFKELGMHLKEFIREKEKTLKELHLVENSIPLTRKSLLELQRKVSAKLSISSEKKAYLFGAAMTIAQLLKANHAMLLLETQGINALNNYFEKIKSQAEKKSTKSDSLFLSSKHIQAAIKKCHALAVNEVKHPKVVKIIELIQNYIANENNARIIVFNHYRDSVETLVKELNDKGLKAEAFVGQAKKLKSKGLSQKEQAQKIKQFNDGIFNVLVATSVAEEGIDIPSCDLVILFEPVPSEIRHIQRIGRTARIRKGKAIILITKGTRDEAFYWAAKHKERKMYQHLREFREGFKMKQQSTLKAFAEKHSNAMPFVLADNREMSSTIVLLLKEKNINVKTMQLDVGDYIIDNDIVIERKSTSDFLSSIIDGRLFNQLQAMANNYSKPLLIIEGHPNELFSLRNIHPNAIIGALASITLNFRVPLLFTKDIHETAQFIYVIAKRAIEGKSTEIRLRVEKPSLSLNEQQRFIIESLPGIGPRTAKALLKRFNSIKNVFNASEKEFMEIENIGEKKAKAIRKLIEAKYVEGNNTIE